jgi:hypothetical protein
MPTPAIFRSFFMLFSLKIKLRPETRTDFEGSLCFLYSQKDFPPPKKPTDLSPDIRRERSFFALSGPDTSGGPI